MQHTACGTHHKMYSSSETPTLLIANNFSHPLAGIIHGHVCINNHLAYVVKIKGLSAVARTLLS